MISGAVQGDKAKRYLEFASNMTLACYQLYNSTTSGGWVPGSPRCTVHGCPPASWTGQRALLGCLHPVVALSIKWFLGPAASACLVLRGPLFLLPLPL